MNAKAGVMEFILTGFRQSESVRHYLFQVIAPDRSRHDVSIDADLDMMRRYGISIQEMPLLCKRLLETCGNSDGQAMMVFPEQTMETYASDRAAAKLAQEMRRKRPIKRQAGNVNWGSGTAGAGKAPPHAI